MPDDRTSVELCLSCGEIRNLNATTMMNEITYTCETCGSVVRTEKKDSLYEGN